MPIEDILKLADLGITGCVLVFVLWMARQAFTTAVEWLPRFHGAMERQSQAVVDLAEASKTSQETQESTLAVVRAISKETDRQSEEMQELKSQGSEMLALLRALTAAEGKN